MDKDPFPTCYVCLAKDRCKKRTGKLEFTDVLSGECGGFVILQKAIELSGIPKEFRYATKDNYIFDDDNMKYKDVLMEHFVRVIDLVKKGANTLFVSKQKGTGKTRAACTIGNEFILKTCLNPQWFDFENPLVLYVKYGQWANSLRSMHLIGDQATNKRVHNFVEKMKNVPLLIIDDIGSGRITPIVQDLTYDVIDYRKENQLSTIYTSNILPDDLEKSNYLGDIIVSRMLYRTTVIELSGKDRRREAVYYP